MRIGLPLIVGLATIIAGFVALLMMLAMRAQGAKVRTGEQGMVSERGEARSALGPALRGKVAVHGELWNAVADEPIGAGQAVEVVAVDGMTLKVRPLLGVGAASFGGAMVEEES
jgi:membrane-bound serine protease (ClpP class)